MTLMKVVVTVPLFSLFCVGGASKSVEVQCAHAREGYEHAIVLSWEDLEPARPYQRNASLHPSKAALATCSELLDGLDFSHGKVVHTSGAWRGKIDTQVFAAVEDASLPGRLIGIGEIRDDEHPAWTNDRKAYLAFAKQDIGADTVLGFYAGTVKHVSELQEESPHWSGRAIALQGGKRDGLVIDGNRECNELAMVNDHRKTDAKAPMCSPNAAMARVWVGGEALPRVMFVTTRALVHGEEIVVDYGEAYWTAWRPRAISAPLVFENFLSVGELTEFMGNVREGPVALGSWLAVRLSETLGVTMSAMTEVEQVLQRNNGVSTKHVDKNPDGSSPRTDTAIVYLNASAPAILVIDSGDAEEVV